MERMTLGTVATYVNGRAFKPDEWEETGKPIIRIQNLTNTSDVFNRTTKTYEEKYLVSDGDLLFAWSASLGAHIWHGEDGWLNQHIFKVMPAPFIDKMYLYYYLLYVVDQLYTKTHGSGMVHITLKPFKETPIMVPSLATQKLIVDRIESLFSKLDEAKEKAQSVIDSYEERKSAILHQAFSGELTENWRNDNDVSRDEWIKVSLSDVCIINPPKTNVKDFSDDCEVSFFPMPSLSEKFGEITEPQIRLLGEVKTGYTSFLEGDVVFAKITPCMENGKSAVIGKLLNDIGFGTTEFFVLRCGEKINNRFLWYILRDRSFRDEAKAEMTGAVGQQRVPKKFLEDYQLALPPILEQKVIIYILDDCFEKELKAFDCAEAVIAQIESVKKALLAFAFRGGLEIGSTDDEPANMLLGRIL